MNRLAGALFLSLVLTCTFMGASTSCSAADNATAASAPWSPDAGDGTYQNPVLFADYSDPDVIRVGDDYYLISSSFTNVPGLPVLHSRDLVNWTILTYALPRLVPEDHFNVPRQGAGVWAPAIRFHGGRFYIFYPDPDFGIYLVTAKNAGGPWSAPTLVRGGKGLIDPCPFWDDDGQAWLIHAWARSRSGKSNILTLCKMSVDGTHLLDDGQVIIDANQIPGWNTLEGPKLYKHDGWYYVFAPAGGVATGWQAVFRAKDIHGPYEHRVTLEQGRTPINGPHQGAWVDTPSGQNWFLHFQDRSAYGRVVHLQPMVWREDWPVMGDGGEPVLTHAKPDVPKQPIEVPQTSDEFAGPELALAWQWQANPQAEWANLTDHPGWLRLACAATPANFYQAGNLLTQKFPAPEFSATTEMQFTPSNKSDAAGLIVFGQSYAWIGVRQTDTGARLCLIERQNASSTDDGKETEITGVPLPGQTPGTPIHLFLRLTVSNADLNNLVGHAAICSFSYSFDGTDYLPLAPNHTFNAEQGRWVGAKVGLFAGNLHDAEASGPQSTGHADFNWFRITPPVR
jgi:beta-xylosidase